MGREADYAYNNETSVAAGILTTIATYIAVQGAAVRTGDRVYGHLPPVEDDLKVLGIENMRVYSGLENH
jgi:hypothetical protein